MSKQFDEGSALAARLFAGRTGPPPALSPDLRRFTIEHLFGDVWQGTDLDLQERSMITCTVLVALGRESEQLLHFRGARNLGIERKRIEAMITHVAHYAGWPVAISAQRNLAAVWAEMDAAANSDVTPETP